MKLHQVYYGLMACVALLMSTSCSSERNEPELQPEGVQTEEVYNGPVQELSINLETELAEDNLRAMDGLEFGDNGKLFPASADGKVKALLLIGNASRAQTVDLTLDYDAKTRKATYKGKILNIPAAALTGAVKARLFVYPDGWYQTVGSTRSIVVPEQFAEEPAAGKPIEIKVPYFSDWQEVTVQKNDKLPTDIKGAKLKPQGQIIRLQVSNTQTEMESVLLHKFIFESNVMSRSGRYNVHLSAAVGEPRFLPNGSLVRGTQYYRYNVKPNSPVQLPKGAPKNFYLWVEGRSGVAQPYTRTLMSIEYKDPVLDPTSDNWWTGKVISEAGTSDEYKVVASGYNNSAMTNAGATYRLELSNRNAVTPLTRFAFYYMSAKADQASVNKGYGEVDTAPDLIEDFSLRFYPGHTRYTLKYLLDNKYLPSVNNGAYTALTTLRSRQYKNNGEGLSWRIPTIRELRYLLPSYTSDISYAKMFDFTDAYNGTATAQERMIDGDQTTFDASYSRNNLEVQAIRFKGASDVNKCWYQYRRLGGGRVQDHTQVQARYLGKYYPEIQTADDFKNFKGILPTIEERIIAWNNYYKDTESGMLGNYFWVRTVVDYQGNKFYYRIKADFNTGTIGEAGFSQADGLKDNRTGGVLLIRDFK